MAKKLAPFSAIQKAKDYIDNMLSGKVDKVSGKGLSTNDYTTTEKNKLSGIASGAEVNIQSDWNQTTTTADDYIKNKPSSMPASDVYAWAKASTKPSYTASEVGLGNVGNFKAVSTVASQGLSDTEKANARANIGAGTSSFSGSYNDLSNKPSSLPASDVYAWAKASTKPSYTASEVGLGNVGNFKAVSTVASQGLSDTEKANARANIGAGTSSFSGSYNDLSNKPTSLPASDVYSWAKASTKPSYTASEVGAIASTTKGAANGVAELDSSGKVPSSQLPSYVDDVLEYDSKSSFPSTGETGKIYVDKATSLTWRWSGSAYVEISPSLALGETSSTAYRGDRGKTAYDHSQSTHARTDATAVSASSTNGNIKINGTETTVYTHPGSGTNPHGTTKSDVGLGNVGNFKAVSTVASQGLSDTEKANARTNIGAGTSSFSGSYNDLSNKPTSLPASDVYSWAKASTKPTYTASEVGLGNVGNFKAVSTVANQGLSDTEKANARANIGAASDALATTSVKGLMSPDDKNTFNALSARLKIRVITAQNSYNSSTGKSTVTFTLNPNNLDGYGKFYRVSSMDSTGFGCMFTFHCFAGGLNIASDKLNPNCTMTTSGNPSTGLTVTLVSVEGVGYSGQFRVKVETINY